MLMLGAEEILLLRETETSFLWGPASRRRIENDVLDECVGT